MSTSFAPLVFPVLDTDQVSEAVERARVQGHAAGYAAGRREATRTLEQDRAALRAEAEQALAADVAAVRSAVAALRGAAAALDARATAVLAGADDELLAAAVDLAAVIVGRELEDREGSAVAAVRRALDGAGGAVVRAVRLHPLDLQVIETVAALEPDLDFVPDPSLARGDAVADLVDGVVDARIATALARVRNGAAEVDG